MVYMNILTWDPGKRDEAMKLKEAYYGPKRIP
jgi:hypothetical protein